MTEPDLEAALLHLLDGEATAHHNTRDHTAAEEARAS